MKDQILIIGDIAGRFTELKQLIRKARSQFGDFSVVSVGDMVDRGPDSRKVVEYFRRTPNAFAIRGNHEDMMIDYVTNNLQDEPYTAKYGWGIWMSNGGAHTLLSYQNNKRTEIQQVKHTKHLDYLQSLPLYIEHDSILITHAPIPPQKLEALDFCWNEFEAPLDPLTFCWNRGNASRIKGIDMQFHGHNAIKEPKFFEDEKGVYAVNIDTSRAKVLTGIMRPSLDTISIPYTQEEK